MNSGLNIYHVGTTPIHRCDARVKVVLLLAYSIMLFFVETWAGLLLAAACCLVCLKVAQLPLREIALLLIPVTVLAVFALVFNTFSWNIPESLGSFAEGAPRRFFSLYLPPTLGTRLVFVSAGFEKGLFFALRMLLLASASFVLCFTTTSTALTKALLYFLYPLRHLRFPAEDAATVCSLALRFIPITAQELTNVKNAQRARGATFDKGSLLEKLHAWTSVFIPLFTGLFRRADTLADALDVRCYGLRRTSRVTPALRHLALQPRSWVTLLGGLAVCAGLAICL